jgi:decaprenylphospho-beta-D-erythro-pentofuranosid-2-ulose 2-reductase
VGAGDAGDSQLTALHHAQNWFLNLADPASTDFGAADSVYGASMKRILILGATSAVASEIAAAYAQSGAKLHLVGRNAEKLAAVSARCCGAAVTSERADFDDLNANEAVVARAIAALGGLDIALVAHGELGDQLATEVAFAAAQATFHTNLLSVVSLLVPLANALEQQQAGQLAVITSVAGDRGRPRNYTYGAAKGALTLYLQGVRTRLYSAGIGVTTIKLGPVDSPMTVGHDKNALFVQPKVAAKGIIAAIEARAEEAYVPKVWSAIMPVVRNLPEPIIQRLKFLSGR